MKKKSILFIAYNLYNGGAERSLVNLLSEINYKQYDVDLLLFKKEGIFLNEVPKEVNIITADKSLHVLFDSPKENSIKFKFFRYYYTLLSVGKKGVINKIRRWITGFRKLIPKLEKEYDIAIAYIQWEPIFYLVDKVNANKKIAWIHTDLAAINISNDSKNIINEYFSKIDNIVTISDKCANSISNIFPSVSNKVTVLENITSSKTIKAKSKQYYPKEYINKEKIIFLSIGRLVPVKGFDISLRVAKILKEKYKLNFEWFFIGDGKLKKQLKKMQKELLVNDCTKFIGTRDNPYPYIANSDLIIQTSLYEGKSMVIDEAKILNKLVLITNYNTASNQINNGIDGVISEFGEENIAYNINNLINNDNLKSFILKNMSNTNYDNIHEIKKYYELFEGDI